MDATVFGFREVYFRIQLQGLLKDIGVVYKLICHSGCMLQNDENKIRNEFGHFFCEQTYKASTSTAKDYYYDQEAWLPKSAGRVDMRFLSPNCYGHQDAFFAIECKRLDSKSPLCQEYVDNGIRRFTTGKYPSLLGCNAMLGFVVSSIDLTTTIESINKHLDSSEYLTTTSTKMTEMVGLKSHHSMPHSFVLYHLWMDFSRIVSLD